MNGLWVEMSVLAKDVHLQITSPADDNLRLGDSGIIHVPCNTSAQHIITFIRDNAHLAKSRLNRTTKLKHEIEVMFFGCNKLRHFKLTLALR